MLHFILAIIGVVSLASRKLLSFFRHNKESAQIVGQAIEMLAVGAHD
jgi:hypothetical protein